MEINFSVYVNRTIRPVYPPEVEILHLEMECMGPSRFQLSEIKKMSPAYPGYVDNYSTKKMYNPVFDYLEKTGKLFYCLSLQDALAIKKVSIKAFKKVFGYSHVVLWKSIGTFDSSLYVPSMFVDGGEDNKGEEIEITWDKISHSYPSKFTELFLYKRKVFK